MLTTPDPKETSVAVPTRHVAGILHGHRLKSKFARVFLGDVER